jgi:hypothetical protein
MDIFDKYAPARTASGKFDAIACDRFHVVQRSAVAQLQLSKRVRGPGNHFRPDAHAE